MLSPVLNKHRVHLVLERKPALAKLLFLFFRHKLDAGFRARDLLVYLFS